MTQQYGYSLHELEYRSGIMGVPISFLDKYSPEQFEIIGGSANGLVPDEFKSGNFRTYNNPIIGARKIYQRILVRHRIEEPLKAKGLDR